MSKEKQIEEMAKEMCEDCAKDIVPCAYAQDGELCDTVLKQAEFLYNAGYRKQSDEHEKRIVNQREELRRLNKRVNDLTQSRDVWKKQAERVGKQLHEVLSKQSEGEWITDEKGFVTCSNCGEEHTWDEFRPPYCDMCGAKMKGGAE